MARPETFAWFFRILLLLLVPLLGWILTLHVLSRMDPSTVNGYMLPRFNDCITNLTGHKETAKAAATTCQNNIFGGLFLGGMTLLLGLSVVLLNVRKEVMETVTRSLNRIGNQRLLALNESYERVTTFMAMLCAPLGLVLGYLWLLGPKHIGQAGYVLAGFGVVMAFYMSGLLTQLLMAAIGQSDVLPVANSPQLPPSSPDFSLELTFPHVSETAPSN